jgi:hypothetical protein
MRYTILQLVTLRNKKIILLQDTNSPKPRVDGLRKAFEAYGDQVRNTRTYVTSRTAEYATLAQL